MEMVLAGFWMPPSNSRPPNSMMDVRRAGGSNFHSRTFEVPVPPLQEKIACCQCWVRFYTRIFDALCCCQVAMTAMCIKRTVGQTWERQEPKQRPWLGQFTNSRAHPPGNKMFNNDHDNFQLVEQSTGSASNWSQRRGQQEGPGKHAHGQPAKQTRKNCNC